MALTLVLVHFVVLATARAVVNVKDSYTYSYSVNDEATGDFKSHQETRSGGLVRGAYSVLEPGGILRTVEYTADPVRGFRATVHRRALPPKNRSTGRSTPQSTTPSTQRLILTLEKSPSTLGRSRSTSQRTPSTHHRTLSTSKTSPSTSERSSSTSGRLQSTSERSPSTSERSRSTLERSPSTSERSSSTSGRLQSISERSPSTSESSRSTLERSPSTSERSLPTKPSSPSMVSGLVSTSEGLQSTSTLLQTSTYAPDNLGHFAAAMFGTRRKKLYRRQQQ